jgi:hypothetical protein
MLYMYTVTDKNNSGSLYFWMHEQFFVGYCTYMYTYMYSVVCVLKLSVMARTALSLQEQDSYLIFVGNISFHRS